MITETEISMYTGYNGCKTTTCRAPDDAFISWVDGSMTTMGESRKGAHSPNNSLANPKTKVKLGCWNVRTTKKGSTARDLEKDYRKRVERERFRNMGSSSIGCRGQNSLEAESLRPNSPLGEWINDDDMFSIS